MQHIEFETMITNGQINIPYQYREDFDELVKVTIEKTKETNDVYEEEKPKLSVAEKRALLDSLVGIIKDPISIEEAREERLARQ
ncbi:MAG: hypothetical protein LBN20_03595 [Endomicrobium sp.]|jgi:hypothetical protein|nr:hypothetical protein [Endomicrobium sp.]